MELPNTPDDMPRELHNDSNWIRNLIVTLDQYSYVDITWERDEVRTRETGESHGEWSVTLTDGSVRVDVEHEELTNALWFATTVADSKLSAAYAERIKARAVALNKLTREECRLLGVLH